MHPFEAAVIFCLNHIQRTGDGPAGEAAERHLAAIEGLRAGAGIRASEQETQQPELDPKATKAK